MPLSADVTAAYDPSWASAFEKQNGTYAGQGIPVLDVGVPVLSMHSPFEVIHKTDLYMAYRAFTLFNQKAD